MIDDSRSEPSKPLSHIAPAETDPSGYIDFHGYVGSHYLLVGWTYSNLKVQHWSGTGQIETGDGPLFGEYRTIFFHRDDVAEFGVGVIFLVNVLPDVVRDVTGFTSGSVDKSSITIPIEQQAICLQCSEVLRRIMPILVSHPEISGWLFASQSDPQIPMFDTLSLSTSSQVTPRLAFIHRLLDNHSRLIDANWIVSSFGVAIDSFGDPSSRALALQALGSLEDFCSCTFFDRKWYQRQHNNLHFSNYFDYLEHYLLLGESWGSSPNPFLPFSLLYSKGVSLTPSSGAGESVSYLEYFVNRNSSFEEAVSFHFDPWSYQKQLEKLGLICPPKELELFGHYVATGSKIGLSPNPLFDEIWYTDRYPDALKAVTGGKYPNAFSHYLLEGEADGRQPNAFFEPRAYLTLNDDIARAVATKEISSVFGHYWRHGFREWRQVDELGLGNLVSLYFSEQFPRVRDARCARKAGVPAERFYLETEDPLEAYKRGHVRPLLVKNLERSVANEIDSQTRLALRAWFWENASPAIRIMEFEHPLIYPDQSYHLYVGGFAFLPFAVLISAYASINDVYFDCKIVRTVRTDFAEFSPASVFLGETLQVGFFACIDFDAAGLSSGIYDLQLSFSFLQNFEQKEFAGPLVRITVSSLPEESESYSKIQVCMATYNPPSSAFEHQLTTILYQQDVDLALIVSDDCSAVSYRKNIHSLTRDVDKITFYPSQTNLGFIGNFERSLRLRSKRAEYLLFSDQDDAWYPDKVRTLLKIISETEACCVFSDMRVTKSNGEVIASSFWGKRKLHYQGSIALAIANTITGAASMFSVELAAKLIPFPRFSQIYHDQWLAVLGSAVGPIGYVDRPLYDYIQHGANVLGYSGSRGGEVLKWKTVARCLATLRHRPAQLWTDRECDYFILSAGQSRGALLQRYVLLSEALHRVRLWSVLEEQEAAEAFCAVLAASDYTSIPFLARYWRCLRKIVGGDLAFIGADYVLKAALSAHVLSEQDNRAVSARVYRRLHELSHSKYLNKRIWQDQDASDFERKLRPIAAVHSLRIRPRMNIFLPELRLATFFGGYYSKIALAKQLLAVQVSVRVVLIDQPYVDYTEVLEISNAFPDLATALDEVDLVAIGNRDKHLDLGKEEMLMATTWWSAHIVERLRIFLAQNHFYYLIQEYEPFTFPLGTWYRAAEESYEFPHIPIFSTEMLSDYFKSIGAGVFRKDVPAALLRKKMVFRNPIVGVSSTERRVKSSRRKQLLFYARPQAHAARNMYEFGLAALRLMVERLGEQAKEWDFIGIGAGAVSSVSLSPTISLRLIDKLDFDSYKEILAQSLVGLVLMYTPHPSLVPIEMAAAGLKTVTNSCFSKTSESFSQISDNIIVAHPTISGIADAIIEAIRCVNKDLMSLETLVDWPDSPEKAFPHEWVRELLSVATDEESVIRNRTEQT